MVPTRKRQDENKRCPNRNRKGKEEKKQNEDKSTSATQELKKTARKGNTHTSGSQGARGGDVAPRRNNRITESATKESREAKVKAKKAIYKNQTENDKTKGQKRTKNGQGMGRGERQKGEEKNEETKKKRNCSDPKYKDRLHIILNSNTNVFRDRANIFQDRANIVRDRAKGFSRCRTCLLYTSPSPRD